MEEKNVVNVNPLPLSSIGVLTGNSAVSLTRNWCY